MKAQRKHKRKIGSRAWASGRRVTITEKLHTESGTPVYTVREYPWIFTERELVSKKK